MRSAKTMFGSGPLISFEPDSLEVVNAADETPAAEVFGYGKDNFVPPFFQIEVNTVVFNIHDPQESGIAKAIGTSSGKQGLPIQKDCDLIAIAERHFLNLIANGIDSGACKDNFPARTRANPLRWVSEELPFTRTSPVPIYDDHARCFDAHRLPDRKSTRLNSSHLVISYAVFCLKKK